MRIGLKKIIAALLIAFVFAGGIFADEANVSDVNESGKSEKTEGDEAKAQNARGYIPPATSFLPMLTILGIYQPNTDMIDLKIPYFMPMVQGRFSHRFTDFGKKPELEFIADGELAPLWLRAGVSFGFKPFSFLKLSAGGDIGTSWGFDFGFLSMDFIGGYNWDKKEYEYFTPFTHWIYDFWAQAGLSYDVGSLFTGGKQHVLLGAGYRATYRGSTGCKNGEIWMNQGVGENTNGFSYSATGTISYMIPNKYFKSVGLSATAAGYYSECYFDEEYRIMNPTFVDLTFTVNASAALDAKNRFMLMVPVSGKRNFCDDKNLRPITEPDGRKWQFEGILLTFTHIF